MFFTVQEAATEIGISAQGVRTAIRRGQITTVPSADATVRITREAVERYRRRKKGQGVSWGLAELPAAELAGEPARLLSQQLVRVESPWRRTDVLVRVYSQAAHSPAAAIVVVGDLQRGAGPVHDISLADHIDSLFSSVAWSVPAGTSATDVAWVIAPGVVGPLDQEDQMSVFSTSVIDVGAQRMEVASSQLEWTATVDRVLGYPLPTWPAIDTDQRRQKEQWWQAITRPDQFDTWVIDPGHAQDHIDTLEYLIMAAGDDPVRQQFVAHVADEVAGVFELHSASRLSAYSNWIAGRFAVPVRRWSPDDRQRTIAAQWAAKAQADKLTESYGEALRWLRAVDQYSPSPDPTLAERLQRAVGWVRFYNREHDLPRPDRPLSVESLRLNGDVAEEWVESLKPLDVAGGSNSDEDRRIRALQTDLDKRRADGRQFGPLMRDEKGVPCAVSATQPSVTVVRPCSYEHLTLDGATVEAHNPGGEGGDLAVFIRDRDGAVSVLPHVSSSGGVNFGYTGGGTGSLATDIACARAQVTQSDDAPEGSVREIEEFLSQPGMERFTIAL